MFLSLLQGAMAVSKCQAMNKKKKSKTMHAWLAITRGPTLQIQRTRFQNFLRFQDFTRDFKISLEISRFHSRFQDFTRDFKISSRFQDFIEISRFHSRFQDFSRYFRISFEISGFHSRFQDFSKISIEISTPELYTFVSFNASASMNEGNSSRFVFRYGTAVTAMGQVFTVSLNL